MKEASTSEAWPILGKYRNTCFVVKLGGQPLTDPEALNSLAFDLSVLRQTGIRVVVVHGGGPQLTEMSERLGLAVKKIDGRRVTDARTLKLAKMAVNQALDAQGFHIAQQAAFNLQHVGHAHSRAETLRKTGIDWQPGSDRSRTPFSGDQENSNPSSESTF